MTLKELSEIGREKINAGEAVELLHITKSEGSTPRGNDAYMIVDKDGVCYGTVGGGKVEYLASLDGLGFLKEKRSLKRRYSLSRESAGQIGMVCGGTVEIEFTYLGAGDKIERENSAGLFSGIEKKYLKNQGKVIIFGGGHISVETVPVLVRTGFSCTVYDDREEFSRKENFPLAKEVICAPYDDIFSYVDIGKSDYVIIMTRGHQYDYEIQRQVLKTDARFIGVIGSMAKLEVINKKLLEDGFEESELERFFAPVGLPIAAETPEEIAVSIAAELILVRADAEGRRKVKQGRTIKLSTLRAGGVKSQA